MTISSNDSRSELEKLQSAFCARRNIAFVPAPFELKCGFAFSTKGQKPVNGLRHQPEKDTNGWYIWFGEHFSEAADFFAPVHTSHICEEYPEAAQLLGLPPGYRFLIADDYLDVWYDPSLLNA